MSNTLLTAELRAQILNLLRDVWNGRNEGVHAWLQINESLWLTIEPGTDEDGSDILDLCACSGVDMLGYAYGKWYRGDWLTEENLTDSEDSEYIDEVLRYLIDNVEY